MSRSLVGQAVLEQVQRLLELPVEIARLERQRVALRAERRSVEDRLARQRIVVLMEAFDLDPSYKVAKNQVERTVLLEGALHNDDVWSELAERVAQLTTTIERVEADLSALDHERKALKAALEREYASIIEQVLSDRMLADAVTGRRVRAGEA